MKVKFTNAKIAGISVCVPRFSINIENEIDKFYDGDEKRMSRIRDVAGFSKRHVVNDYTTASDLCLVAANDVISGINIEKNEIDAIIMVTQTPDFSTPCTAAWLHGKLNLSDECAMFDVNQGCAGYIRSLVSIYDDIKWLIVAHQEMSYCVLAIFKAD